jgi:hypothetical protein
MSVNFTINISVFHNPSLNVNFIRAVLLPTETTEEVVVVDEPFYAGDAEYVFTYENLNIIVGEHAIRVTDTNEPDQEIVWRPEPELVEPEQVEPEPVREIILPAPVWNCQAGRWESGYIGPETVSDTTDSDRPDSDEESQHHEEDTTHIHYASSHTCHVCSSINQHCICLRGHCWHCGTRL